MKWTNSINSRQIMTLMLPFVLILAAMDAKTQVALEKDVISTSAGPAEITFVGHGSLMISFQDKIIHIDPYSKMTDYAVLPKADLILITHEHGDHLDVKLLPQIRKANTEIVYTQKCSSSYPGGIVMHNGETRSFGKIKIEAVPAYNLVNRRDATQVYHPKGEGNGYILTMGDKRIYIAGDTENTPEMKALKNIDVAFLPMNLPYTMTPEMVADAVKAFRPKILYPYHYGDTDTQKLVDLLKTDKDTEIRIRKMH